MASQKASVMVMCSKCGGEGSINTKPSKKARHAYKVALDSYHNTMEEEREKEGANKPQPPPSAKVSCKACSGVGLIDASDKLPLKEEEEAEDLYSLCDVVIVGGGIGGCALALALQQRNIPCRVYERDQSMDERTQGYGLTMQQVNSCNIHIYS